MRLLAVILFALALAVPALAAGPREAPALEPAASWVAGKPVQIDCAPSDEFDVGEGGWAYIDQGRALLDDQSCQILLRRLRAKPAKMHDMDLSNFAGAILGLAHESVHLSGERDESITECKAIRRIPGLASRFFGFKTWRSRHDLMSDVWAIQSNAPDAYQFSSC